MRFDINLDLCFSVDVYDAAEAEELAERVAARLESETEWVVSTSLTGPHPLATVLTVVPVGGGARG